MCKSKEGGERGRREICQFSYFSVDLVTSLDMERSKWLTENLYYVVYLAFFTFTTNLLCNGAKSGIINKSFVSCETFNSFFILQSVNLSSHDFYNMCKSFHPETNDNVDKIVRHFAL